MSPPVLPALRSGDIALAAGWALDATSARRLDLQLSRLPDDVAAIAPRPISLASGSSYRTQAEWSALEPLEAVVTANANVASGAAVVRSGTHFEIEGSTVRIEGRVLIDPGATVHDTRSVERSLEVASPLGRSPFPWRPVAVFMAFDLTDEAADWSRALSDALLAQADVEARVAVLDEMDPPTLTRPCLASEDSLRALRADVVVALDEPALAAASRWCKENRSLALVEVSGDKDIDLVSWRIGEAQHRLRARIGPVTDSAPLAQLVNRLCAGPHPIPPLEGRPARPASSPRVAPAVRSAP